MRAAGCMIKNKIAKDLRTPKYRPRVIKDKKKLGDLSTSELEKYWVKVKSNAELV